MTIWKNFVTMALMLAVFALALLFASSSDWRDRVLAFIVMTVYISLGAYRTYVLTKNVIRKCRNESSSLHHADNVCTIRTVGQGRSSDSRRSRR